MILTKLCGCCSGVILCHSEYHQGNGKGSHLRKALPARIIVGAIQAFLEQCEQQGASAGGSTYVSISINLGVAHITDGVVQDWLRFGLWNWGSRRSGGLVRLPLAFTGKDGVNDDATGLLNFEELMGNRMTTSPVGDASSAHVVVCRDVSNRERISVSKRFVPGQSRHLCLMPRIVDSQTSQTTPI